MRSKSKTDKVVALKKRSCVTNQKQEHTWFATSRFDLLVKTKPIRRLFLIGRVIISHNLLEPMSINK